jgi:3-oxoacyl-[acyl-carrier protein] reductase
LELFFSTMTNSSLIDLSGKCALVTGGSRGIGAAVCRQLASVGANIMVGYRTRKSDAEKVVAECSSNGVRAVAFATDISTESGAESLIRAMVAELGGLDVFVGNAGIWPPRDVALGDMSSDQWSRTLRENIDSVFFTTRASVRAMRDGGSIVLVSSTAGQRGEAFHADYAASKGAVISLTKSLAVELGGRDINVNCVAPGWVDTEMVSDAVADTGRSRIEASIPIGRIASADDIAGPIVFLCSSMARHITGEILNVNGGSVLCG